MKKLILIGFVLIYMEQPIVAQTTFLQQDFTSASGTNPPAGWTTKTITGDTLIDKWHFDNPGRREPGSPISSPFAVFDSDRYSNNGQTEVVYLISPSFNATTTDNIILEFDQYFKSGYSGSCEVEVFNGTAWISIYTNSSTTANPHHSTFDITNHIQNKTNAQIRFKWIGNYSWFWIIDNVKAITQPVSSEQFTELTGISIPDFTDKSVVFGDYDNDGYLDILISGNMGGNILSRIYRNNGNNTFSEQTNISLPGVVKGSVAWGDYDNDSDLDILLTGGNIYLDRISKVFQNKGGNTFIEQSGLTLPGIDWSSVAWGDYDNDGYMDILLTGNGSSSLVPKLFRNNGGNTFIEQASILFPSIWNGSVAWGDYDSDGYMDIVLSGATGSGFVSKIYHNNGNNSFTELTNINLKGVNGSSVAWGDYDNDGDLDILLTGDTGTKLVSIIYLNDGNHTFTEQTSISLQGVSNGSIAWFDYNNDGNLDILLTGNGITKIYRNNGNKTFSEHTGISLPGTSNNRTALVVDFDNDGNLDIFLHNKIYRNNNSKKNTPPNPPNSIVAYLTGKKLNVSWDKGTDPETPQLGLTYNLRIGITEGGCEILSPMALEGGKRTIVAFGNMGHNTKYTIDLSRFSPLPDHIYYSVQAIDNSFMGSPWTPEKSEVSNFVADFLPEKACQNTVVQFQDKSYSIQYPITTWQCKFIDGSSTVTSSIQNPAYTFQTAGIQQVELTITNSNGEKTTRTKSITVLPSPLVDFTASKVCQGTPVIFDNTTSANTTSIESWFWNFGDSTTNSTMEEPGNHGYMNPGDYLVKLIALSSNGCSGSVEKTITVVAYPVGAVSSNGPLTFCEGDSVKLSTDIDPNYIYKWLLGGTAITNAVSSSFVARQSGVYSVEITNKLFSCSKTSSGITITNLPAPDSPTITTSGSSTFCQGDSVILTVTNNPSLSYHWKLNGGAVGVNSYQYVAKNQGKYSLEITNSNGCKSISANSITTVINPLPNLKTVSLTGSTEFCEGDSLSMSVPFTAGYTYRWRNAYGFLAGATSNIYSVKTSGQYSLKITDANNCSISTSPINIVVRLRPESPKIVVENYDSGQCNIEQPIVLRVDQPTEGFSYLWKRNGSLLTLTSQTYIQGFLSQGEYTVLAENEGCTNESKPQKIYFENAPPKPFIYAEGPNVWFLACSNDSAKKYIWYYNGNVIQGANSYLYVAKQNLGTYSVTIGNDKGCYTSSDVITIPFGTTGQPDPDPLSGIKIFPNPTLGLFVIEMYNELYGQLEINILTEGGRRILKITADKNTRYFSQELDLRNFSKGIYILIFKIDKFFTTRKLIIN